MKFSEYLLKAKTNNSFPHALLITTNGCINYDNLIKKYLKTILCSIKTLYCDECATCNIINNETYINLIVIDAFESQLNKESVLSIQKSFSNSITSKENINLYVIKNIENANKVSINSLLKFVEEPPINTFALFFTKNQSLVIDTIVSRCQKINILNENNYEDEMINECFSDVKQYENFKLLFDYNIEIEFYRNLVSKLSINDQITFINKFKKLDINYISIIINIIGYFTTIERKIKLHQLKKDLSLNMNKNLFVIMIINILEE